METETVLTEAIERATPMLRSISDEEAGVRPSENKWSKKEILGHLIDSAANNHQRFMRAQFTDDLIFPGYAQEEWVRAQRYHTASWGSLITLWREFNLHIARGVAGMATETREKIRANHNLRDLTGRDVPEGRQPTLELLIQDYVGHLEHHLSQILPTYRKLTDGLGWYKSI